MVETKEEKRARRRKEKEELLAYKIEQGIAMWNPAEHENATKDPYKTLFVSRIVGFIFKPFISKNITCVLYLSPAKIQLAL